MDLWRSSGNVMDRVLLHEGKMTCADDMLIDVYE